MAKTITPQEAERLAKKAVEGYLTACNLPDRALVGDVLMKLVSVAGIVMAHAEGADTAFDRLYGTACFVVKNGPKRPSKLEKLQ